MKLSADDSASYWMLADGYLPLVAGPMGDRLRFARKRGLDTAVEVDRHGAVAVVRCDGLAVRRTEYLEAFLDGFSTESLAETVTRLASDDEVDAIVLWADSPGGEAHGVDSAARAIQAAAERKPVVGQVQGVAHSAMYYLLAGCTRVVAHAEDRVGSIGVIAQLFDTSEMYKAAGVRPVTVTTGPLKGIGAPGEKITDAQREHVEHHVARLFGQFKAFVAEGRGLKPEAVDKLATGGVFSAQEAIDAGLLDGVATLDETLAALRGARAKNQSPQPGEKAVGSTNEEPKAQEPSARQPQPASIEELQLLPGVDDAFCVEALKKGWNADQAQSTWMERQAEANAELAKKLEAAQTGVTASVPGVADADVGEDPPASNAAAGETYEKAVDQLVSKGVDRADAMLRAAQDDPEGHQAFVTAYQERVGAA